MAANTAQLAGVVFAIVILGSIAFLIAAALIPVALADWYNATAALANNTNVSTIIVVLLEIAPIGLPIAILLVFLAMAGLDFGALTKGQVRRRS